MNKTVIEQPQSVSGAFKDLLNKMYISNVQNRLRQLNEPTENDSKRWVWELIQNAKDSIVQDETKDDVDMKIIVNGNEVKIKHNGAPFTAKAQLGLLYKYSEGKVNNSESTGRFGTGFLTTHTLSKTVSIEGDVYKDDSNTDLCGFSATMYRDGLDEVELLEGVERMNESMVYTRETNEWTCYTYHLKTPQNEKALQLGIDNFFANIAQTMLFCKELKSIEINNNGKLTLIERQPYINLEGDIFKTKFILKGNNEYSREFIHISLKKHNEQLSKRFKTDRSIRLTLAIEVDSELNLINNELSPSHFCVLPLVGSEKHQMPVYLNSPDFEPDTDRESLILIGEDILADKEVISEGGINRLILKESVNLFEKLVSYFSQEKYKNLYLLTKGLKKAPHFEKNFNKDWFTKEIILPFREVAKSYSIVETNDGYAKLFDENDEFNILIPSHSDETKQNSIYNLIKDLFPNRIPADKITNAWAKYAWKECGLYKIEDLSEYISEKGNLEELPIEYDKAFEWINEFISFINKTDETLLSKYSLIPNMNGDFISLSNEEVAVGVDLTEYMINCLKFLGVDIKPILINNKVTSISIPLKVYPTSVATKIGDQVSLIIKSDSGDEEKISLLLPIINTIPNNEDTYSSDFIKKQNEIHSLVSTFYQELNTTSETNNDIPQKAWADLHNWLIDLLMRKVEDYKNVNSLPSHIEDKLTFTNDFIGFVSKHIKEGELDKFAIIPNQNLQFCHKNLLSKDVDIPDELKTIQAEEFGIYLKKDLLHNQISSISISKETTINTIVPIINELFNKSSFGEKDDLDFAIYLCHLIPSQSSELLHKSQNHLIEIVRKYYYRRSTPHSTIEINCSTESLWSRANNKLIYYLIKNIEENENINQLQTFLSESGKTYDFGDTIIFLNSVYGYLNISNSKITSSIIPNQKGEFCSLESEFYKDEEIPEILKEVLTLLDKNKDFKNILAESSLSEIAFPKHSKTTEDICKVIDSEINDQYSYSQNWEKEHFIQAIEKLMILWLPKNKWKLKDYFPKIHLKKDTIEMNILWSLEDRQRMQKVKKISPDILDKIIDGAIELDSLEEEKKKLESELEQLEVDSKNLKTNARLKEIENEFPDISANRIRELLKLEERIKTIKGTYDYVPDTEEEIERNFINGYKGEAYVYKQLLTSDHFRNVNWEHKSETETDLSIVDFGGEHHFIKENYSKYDITAESTKDGQAIFIEVKSTRTSLSSADTIPLPISKREWLFVNQISDNEKYCLARVFEVENSPEGHYLTIRGIGITNI